VVEGAYVLTMKAWPVQAYQAAVSGNRIGWRPTSKRLEISPWLLPYIVSTGPLRSQLCVLRSMTSVLIQCTRVYACVVKTVK